ncbi:MAG TPA: hypothetical protein VG755_38645 [Nannocystaceae bacterium]|nr:hypothetical protein [Nannocystaceae bacterium]
MAAALTAAPAAGDGFELEWDAPPECPDASEVRRQADALTRAAGVEMPSGRLHARGIIRATADGFTLDLHLEGERDEGNRRLEAKSCAELSQAAALILTLAINPDADVDDDGVPAITNAPVIPEVTPRDPIEAPTEAPSQPAAKSSSGADDRSGAPPIAVGFRAGVGIDALIWRPVGASLSLGVALIGPRYRVEVTGRYATPSTIAAPTNGALRARAQQWSLGVSACGVPSFLAGALELPICGGIEAGAMHAKGRGDGLVGRNATAPWIAFMAGPTILWRVGRRLAVWAGVDALVLLGRPIFSTDGGVEVVHPRRAGLRALAGVEFRIGRGSR